MTNKEYIEKYNLSFSEVTKMWDNQTNHIEDWLNKEHNTWKFKVGDILCSIYDNITDKIFFVIDYDEKYLYVKEYDRNGNIVTWYTSCVTDGKYQGNNTIKIIRDNEQHYFKKIF